MCPSKTDTSAAVRGGLSAILRPTRRRAISLALIAVAGGAVWAGYAVWQQIRSEVAASDEYRLTPQEIEITPPPPWVRGDVKAEALRSAGLDGPMSILDDDLVQKLQTAFSLHPWVASVVHVSKQYPAHVDVELTYRKPVAMVEVHENGADGLYPVDVDGVLLPSNDFSPLEARGYPRLAGVESSPLGTVGSRWGDPVVAGGARIAVALAPHWAEWKLWSIHWIKPTGASNASAPADFELITGAGQPVHWGAAPANEPPSEPTAEQKVAELKAFVDQHGSLDDPAAKSLDLSQPGAAARTAKAAGPTSE
ncbi:MAG TPA: hypothetical protein VHX65_12950 [Pirellulales bacterium]|nr:hypothetical protein [Pirellulales bacterium]